MTDLDPQDVLGSVEALPEQVLDAFEEAQKIRVPDEYRQAKRFVCAGMGGSGLGARCIETLYADKLPIPLIRVHEYRLPAFVDEETLLLCSSYSGTTEEVLENWEEGVRRKAKLLAIAAKGALLEKAAEAGIPHYRIQPRHNPSDQPRMAVGYSIMGELMLAAKAGLLTITREEVEEAVEAMRAIQVRKEEIKRLAEGLHGKALILAAAEHLVGPLHTVNNQCNENAKTMTCDVAIPELNHHLLEGLQYPSSNKEHLLFLLFNSPSYDRRNQQRLRITAEVAERNGIETMIIEIPKGAKLAEGFALIQLGAYLAYWLAMANGQDPAPIPFVDYFKKRLAAPER